MDPLIIVDTQGQQNIEAPSYQGEVTALLVLIPTSRIGDIDRNDTLRRELTALLAAAIAASTQG